MDYPQRWLKEAQAITSPEGWRKEKTNELLKCQKGLEELYPEVPKLLTAMISNFPESFTLDELGSGKYTVNYSFTEVEYIPKLVKGITSTSGTGTITTTVNQTDKSIEVNVTNGKTDDNVSVAVNIDGFESESVTTKLIRTEYKLTFAETVNVPTNFNLEDDGTGTFKFNYVHLDAKYVPENVTVDITTDNGVIANYTVDKAKKEVTVTITNGEHNDTINMILDIDGVKAQKTTTHFNVAPKIKSVKLGTVPANTTLDKDGNGSNSFTYSYEETRYTPKVVDCKVEKTGSVVAVATVDKESNRVTTTYSNAKNGDTVSFTVNIDGVDSDKKTTTIKVPASLKSVTIGDVPATVEVDGLGEGNFEFGYTYLDADYATISVKCNTTSTTAKVTASPDVPNKKIKVSIEDAVNDEELSFEVEIDGVKSAIKKTTIVRAS